MSTTELALLTEIRDELRALRLATERTGGARPDTGAAPADLLRAIRAAVGDRVFSCADLVAHATLPAALEPRAAIVTAVGALNPRKLGKLLRSIEGRGLDGLTVRRVGADRDGLIWQVGATLRV